MKYIDCLTRFIQKVTGVLPTVVADWGWWYVERGNTCEIHFDMDDKRGDNDPLFHNYCVALSPIATCVSDLTLTVCHECGHYATRAIYDTPQANEEYEQLCAAITDPRDYYDLPAEHAATAWALAWIETHQEIVRQFENEMEALQWE